MKTLALPLFVALLAALACGQPPEPPSQVRGLGYEVSGRSAYASFHEVEDADSYLVQYRPARDVEWNRIEVEQNGEGRRQVLLFDLPPDTYIEIRVASRREGSPDSEFYGPVVFKTLPLNQP